MSVTDSLRVSPSGFDDILAGLEEHGASEEAKLIVKVAKHFQLGEENLTEMVERLAGQLVLLRTRVGLLELLGRHRCRETARGRVLDEVEPVD